MQKSDLQMLRKTLKHPDDCVVRDMHVAYISAENEISWEEDFQYNTLKEDEAFRYLELFKKTLPSGLGKAIFAMPLKTTTKIDPEEVQGMIADAYPHTDPYLLFIAHIVYDVPYTDNVYDGHLAGICPAKLSAPALGYASDKVTELDRTWRIGGPAAGFLYPTLDEAANNLSEAAVFSKHPEEEAWLSEIFSFEDSAGGLAVQTEAFGGLVDELNLTLEEAAEVNSALLERAQVNDDAELSKENLRTVFGDREGFDDAYERTVGDLALTTEIAKKTMTVETDTAKLIMPAEYSQMLERKEINGRVYLMFPADGEVKVNGAGVVV